MKKIHISTIHILNSFSFENSSYKSTKHILDTE